MLARFIDQSLANLTTTFLTTAVVAATRGPAKVLSPVVGANVPTAPVVVPRARCGPCTAGRTVQDGGPRSAREDDTRGDVRRVRWIAIARRAAGCAERRICAEERQQGGRCL